MKNSNNKDICGICKEPLNNNNTNNTNTIILSGENSIYSGKSISPTEKSDKKIFTCETCDKSYHEVIILLLYIKYINILL